MRQIKYYSNVENSDHQNTCENEEFNNNFPNDTIVGVTFIQRKYLATPWGVFLAKCASKKLRYIWRAFQRGSDTIATIDG
mmetsp:Transcript_33760/g.34029  ORF Transcript_33760/g.34029 Transcript_33760/m.34029 type:complete len:80 (+) Transcript_33760:13-252(+)